MSLMTKSKAAFLFSVERLFAEVEHAYLWTFTFPDVPSIDEGAQRWRRLVQWFDRCFKGTVWGLRVYELHKTHGLHLHALRNRHVRVEIVRPAAKRYGFGRIHVKLVDKAGAKYLAKYLTKQGRPECFEGKRLWAAFGAFCHCKVKDVEVTSDFTEAVKFCQQELRRTKLPFLFVHALQQWPTRDPVKLKLACAILKKSGPYVADILRVLRE